MLAKKKARPLVPEVVVARKEREREKREQAGMSSTSVRDKVSAERQKSRPQRMADLAESKVKSAKKRPLPTEESVREKYAVALATVADDVTDVEPSKPKKGYAFAQSAPVNDALTTADPKAIQSVFGQHAGVIEQLLSDDDSDGVISVVSRALVQSLVNVMPLVEHNLRASKGRYGVQGFNQTVSSLRELIVDLRALRDQSDIGVNVVTRVLTPSYTDLAAQIIIAFTDIVGAAQSRMSDAEFEAFRAFVEDKKRNLGRFLQTSLDSVCADVRTTLG